MRSSSKQILLATIGSLGDLHPMLALALALRQRGHHPLIASTELYRAKVEGLGLEFHSLRPDTRARDPEVMRQLVDMRRGPKFLLRELILPALPGTYQDLLAVASRVDLMIAGEIVFAAPLVAEKLGLPWISELLSPFSFYSAYDPPVSPFAPWLDPSGAPRQLNSLVFQLSRIATQHWWKPVRELRREQGLREGGNPLFEAKFSAQLVLALFSPEIAPPQPDWPVHTVQPGYVYYDKGEAQKGLSPELEAFLQAGEAPIVFTLGSGAVYDPRDFFDESAKAAKMLNRRAVFLVGEDMPSTAVSDMSISVPYAPFSELFPRAAVVVHSGGSGTTAQALRAGRPALVMPCAFDQPDNAARVRRIGAGLTLLREGYKARTVAKLLERLLRNPTYAAKAAAISSRLRHEDGVGAACDAIEQLLTGV